VLVSIKPLIERVCRPTVVGDDVARIGEVAALPFRELVLRPFSEHIAPLFQLVSWSTWQLIGRDIRLAPVGFTLASVTAWVFVLALLSRWLRRETGSYTASWIAVALAAQSPLVLETAWWYSSSSFSWAISGILIALLGATWLARKPGRGLFLIALASFVGPAGTTVGILAAPIGSLRAVIHPYASWRAKLLAVGAAALGLTGYYQLTTLGGIPAMRAWTAQAERHEPLAGLGYAFSVPGRLLLPSTLGIPASVLVRPLPAPVAWMAGALVFMVLGALVAWPKAAWNRRLVLIGCAMIYLPYMLIFPARASMLRMGRWSEAQLLYEYTGRYHVLPLAGLAAIMAAVIVRLPVVRRGDNNRALAAALAAGIGILMIFVQHAEAARWSWIIRQPGQAETLAAIRRVESVARSERIPQSQLKRIVDPVFRAWNGSILVDNPAAFHFLNLAARAPLVVERELPDEVARARLRAQLTSTERIALGAGACLSLNPSRPGSHAQTILVGRRPELQSAHELRPGTYRGTSSDSFLEFDFEPVAKARYLAIPGLTADQDVIIQWREGDAVWRSGQKVRWIRPTDADSSVVIDFERLIHYLGGPITGVRVFFTQAGELTIDGAPALLGPVGSTLRLPTDRKSMTHGLARRDPESGHETLEARKSDIDERPSHGYRPPTVWYIGTARPLAQNFGAPMDRCLSSRAASVRRCAEAKSGRGQRNALGFEGGRDERE
jgi:hypothetical protein